MEKPDSILKHNTGTFVQIVDKNTLSDNYKVCTFTATRYNISHVSLATLVL